MAGGQADPEVRLSFLEELARKATPLFKDGFGCRAQGGKVSCKSSPSDLLTQYDAAVENLLVETIKATFPHHVFFCEGARLRGFAFGDAETC